jgi:hypothetical protein
MERIKPIGVNDLESNCGMEKTGRKKGERPVGVPAARGHGGDGGADIRSGLRGPEHIVSVPLGGGGVDRPLGSFSASTKGLQSRFAAFSLKGRRTQRRARLALRKYPAFIEWGGWQW